MQGDRGKDGVLGPTGNKGQKVSSHFFKTFLILLLINELVLDPKVTVEIQSNIKQKM